jgi:hypothetical protein
MKPTIIVVLGSIIALLIPTSTKPIYGIVLLPKPTTQIKALQQPKLTVASTISTIDVLIAPGQPTFVTTDNSAMDYIFSVESGGRLDAVNGIGCVGLGQDCNNALPTACLNWRIDKECQLRFWNNYAMVRYGSWSNALAFRKAHNWW